MDLKARLDHLRDRIAGAGGDPDRITIVAVTKGHDFEAVEAAAAAGLVDMGENYAADLLAKADAARARGLDLRWHFLGHVQRNKVRQLASSVHLWQGVDRVVAGQEIARRAPGASVLVQVDVSGRAGRNGCTWEDAPALVDALRGMGLNVCGLMAVGPGGDPETARPGFRRLTELAAELGLPEVSTGMSGDFEVAVAEGSTMVRLGTALFGPRPQPAQVEG